MTMKTEENDYENTRKREEKTMKTDKSERKILIPKVTVLSTFL